MSGIPTGMAFSPLVPWWAIVALGAAAAVPILFGLFRRARGTFWRAAMLSLLLLALANPSLVEEQRIAQRDVALLIVDESGSQTIGDRAAQREEAVEILRDRLEALPDLDLRVVRVGDERLGAGSAAEGGTRLFRAIERELADVPAGRRAGTIMVTDGQVHDVPDEASADTSLPGGPVHALLTGRPGERDRTLRVVRAPGFGIVGQQVEVTIRVDDLPAADNRPRVAPVTVRQDGRASRTFNVLAGRDEVVRLPIERSGTTVVEFETPAIPGDLTDVNNRAVVVVNGVRDRLRVLLVSGQPHAGQRVWRNLLKSDPAVDLVHFTILRPPEKQDATPIRELSLIAFPIRELFEVKLKEFDLVIFDRYSRRGVIPQLYLANVARYVQEGGALFEAVGPGFAEPFSTLYRTPLGQVLPSEPTGTVHERGFRPRVTPLGERHPVTAGLAERAARSDPWGRWFRHVEVDVREGETLMTGAEERPLLVLSRVGEGRVGQLLSDHIWLWARGFEGGGPHGELLRRTAHWLMREPDLEENALRAEIAGERLLVERRSLSPDPTPVTVTAPDGSRSTLVLEDAGGGRTAASVAIEQLGLYRVEDGTRAALAAAGPPNPLEFADVRATPDRLAPIAAASGGTVRWLADGVPDLRRVRPGSGAHGRGWLGLQANRDYTVTGVREIPLLPPTILLLLIGAALVVAWRREAR
ncbi:MAG: hypothetical protein ACK4QW_06820 [Alphaproteobacteria bacterium]